MSGRWYGRGTQERQKIREKAELAAFEKDRKRRTKKNILATGRTVTKG